MYEIVLRDKKRYTIEKISQNNQGVTFEYNGEIIFCSFKDIEFINANYKPVRAKTYIKKKK